MLAYAKFSRYTVYSNVHVNVTAHGGITVLSGIPGMSGNLSAWANSGYQALFSNFSNGPEYEATQKLYKK